VSESEHTERRQWEEERKRRWLCWVLQRSISLGEQPLNFPAPSFLAFTGEE